MKKTIGKLWIPIIIIIIVIVIIMWSIIFVCTSNFIFNNGTVTKVCHALNEKYGETFAATAIGDRLNTDGAKLYVHPADNKDLLFTARINRKTGEVDDNYVEEKVNYKVERIVADSFDKRNISVNSRCMVVTREPLIFENEDYTPVGFKEKYNFDHYTLYLVIRQGDFTAADLLAAFENANNSVGVEMVMICYIFEPENYSACVEEMKIYAEMGATMIESHSPVSAFNVIAQNGVCSVTEASLQK